MDGHEAPFEPANQAYVEGSLRLQGVPDCTGSAKLGQLGDDAAGFREAGLRR
jgi:hypothetical protein